MKNKPLSIITRIDYKYIRQCRSCKFDTGCRGCTIAEVGVDEDIEFWKNQQKWRRGYPSQKANDCPGWERRPDLYNV